MRGLAKGPLAKVKSSLAASRTGELGPGGAGGGRPLPPPLVPEQPPACEHHGDAMLVSGSDDFLVPD